MEVFIRENPVLSCLLALFAFEQLSYLFTGSYPYRFGLRLCAEELPKADSGKDWKNQGNISGVNLKVSQHREEAYLRLKYPASVWGPVLFSCQIGTVKNVTEITLMGPASAMLVGYLFIGSIIICDGSWSFLNGLCVLAVAAWLYTRFRRRCLVLFDQVRKAAQP